MSRTAGSGPDAPSGPRALDGLAAAAEGLLAHKLRSALTALGIVIGVAATIAVVILMQSLTASLNRQFAGLGSRTVTVRAYTSVEDALRGRFHRLTLADLEVLRRRVEGIRDITPRISVGTGFANEIRYRGVSSATRLYGTTASYAELHNLFPVRGRFLSADDDRTHRRVCVIGERVRQNLKLPADPVGAYIVIAGEWFKVVGVMEARGELFGLSQDDYVLMPYNTALSLNADREPQDLQVAFNVASEDRIEPVQDRVRALLRQSRHLGALQEDDFQVHTAKQLRATYEALSDKLAAALAGIVAVSLVVGGIGIMNVMLVSVTERTREIGIAKALGATRRFILSQFLIEAVLLAVAGGICGVVLGLGAGYMLTAAIPDATFAAAPWWSIPLPLALCACVGVVFGIVPAGKAAALSPVDALRQEA